MQMEVEYETPGEAGVQASDLIDITGEFSCK
jgi:hypothetical protein